MSHARNGSLPRNAKKAKRTAVPSKQHSIEMTEGQVDCFHVFGLNK